MKYLADNEHRGFGLRFESFPVQIFSPTSDNVMQGVTAGDK